MYSLIIKSIIFKLPIKFKISNNSNNNKIMHSSKYSKITSKEVENTNKIGKLAMIWKILLFKI